MSPLALPPPEGTPPAQGRLWAGQGSLRLGTNAVGADEPCWCLKELNQPTPDSRGVHRYQIIAVMRGDPPPVEFRRDLGPAAAFTATEFAIPGGVCDPTTGRYWIEHRVGELVEMAERIRSGHRFEAPEPPKPSDLIGGYHDLPDQRRRAKKRLSMIGPEVRVQRE